MQAWHSRHLESIRLAGFKPKSDKPGNGGSTQKNGSGEEDPKKKSKNHVPQHFIRSKKLCIKYQKGVCEFTADHDIGGVNIVHACALCLFKDRGIIKDHGIKACPKKEKESF